MTSGVHVGQLDVTDSAMAVRREVLERGFRRVIVLNDGQAALGNAVKSVLARSGVLVLSPGRDDLAWLAGVVSEADAEGWPSRQVTGRFEAMMADGIEHGVEAVVVAWPTLLPLVEHAGLGVPVIEVEA